MLYPKLYSNVYFKVPDNVKRTSYGESHPPPPRSKPSVHPPRGSMTPRLHVCRWKFWGFVFLLILGRRPEDRRFGWGGDPEP